ncbi:hypothetical protein [Cupriavidus taiwanensis]|uniref:Uncharacterized protein n=1 Tax=Cupriavidus taiwanensis (strain DSM 17343 / BCRC 17206 / CCUG 44338 / CIP 107171 / LMG 19424 / R1) TaxID=977880 RepID=B3R7Y3_CUPTR|nr:hypothetical protein [Cupriavidus taiwanensis]CAQ70928.1 conserved hypothetical protein, putative transmembrane protein [Cupriavidus taiwanensis LMG 19424]SOY52913.1 conserved hypothetical protein, putative transmembrane protein [Cupriavidus taiwanensis]SPC10417.1 conserved hypothetical protein [Cupriavidus taiwanensis]
MASRNPRRAGRHNPIPGHWWQPGVYGSMPAVALWILARLPAGLLLSVTGTPAAPAWLNGAGDTVFVAGWVTSALLLWLTRRRPAPAVSAEAVPAKPPKPESRATEPALPG